MSKQRVCVGLLLDRSGSMNANKTETIGAVNTYIKGLKKEFKGRFTLTQFDSGAIEILEQYNNAKIKDLPEFTSFDPRGMTPLLDAIGITINKMDTTGFDNVIFVIVTDGQENASQEYKYEQIKALLEEKDKLGWQVAYLGANVDAFAEGARLGITAGKSMNFAGGQSVATMDSFMDSNKRYAARPVKTDTSAADFTDEERKKAVGDEAS